MPVIDPGKLARFVRHKAVQSFSGRHVEVCFKGSFSAEVLSQLRGLLEELSPAGQFCHPYRRDLKLEASSNST